MGGHPPDAASCPTGVPTTCPSLGVPASHCTGSGSSRSLTSLSSSPWPPPGGPGFLPPLPCSGLPPGGGGSAPTSTGDEPAGGSTPTAPGDGPGGFFLPPLPCSGSLPGGGGGSPLGMSGAGPPGPCVGTSPITASTGVIETGVTMPVPQPTGSGPAPGCVLLLPGAGVFFGVVLLGRFRRPELSFDLLLGSVLVADVSGAGAAGFV